MQSVLNNVALALTDSLISVVNFLPNLLAALLIFVAGIFIARVFKKLTLELLKILQLEPFAEKVGLSENLRHLGSSISPAELIGDLVRWTVVIIFLVPAVEVLGLTQIAELVQSLLNYIPNVIVAVVIVMVGTIIADLSADFVRGTAAALSSSTANFLAGIAKYSILIFSVLAALSQLNIATAMVNTLFTGFVAMIAIAGGLAFGLGGKEMAADILKNIRGALSEEEK